MTDDNQSDVQALPPEEFDVRGCRGDVGIPGYYMDGIIATDLPTVTTETIWKQIESVTASLAILRGLDGQSEALARAGESLHTAFAHVCLHTARAAEKSDAAMLASMFGGTLDEEDVALASAAAALGYAPGA